MTATEIGTYMHEFVENIFLSDDTLAQSYNLYKEVASGTGRADIVAVRDETEEDGLGDMWIYVGEIKSESNDYYPPGAKAYVQLATYIARFKQQYPHAYVGQLTSWNPDADGYRLEEDGFDCMVFISTAGNGVYKYSGRSTADGIKNQRQRIENEGFHPLPYNESPNYVFQ